MKTQNLIENKLEKFGKGEWMNEPDKAEWIDEETNLPCLIVRASIGTLCGYVGVPLKSKLAKKDYNDIEVSIHGGLTYGSKCNDIICHEADEEVFWFGFDCAHAGDLTPLRVSRLLSSDIFHEMYRNFEYVKNEVTSLAQQINKLLAVNE